MKIPQDDFGELFSVFQETEPKQQAGKYSKEIGDILSKQPDIENSYVMTRILSYAYYADSKHIHTDFMAGMKNDTVHLRIADQVKVEISRNAIVAKQEEG